MIRITAYFAGRVQGVGFRYTAVNIARRFAVAGYVRNLPDGRRVELVAEGAPSEVGAFVDGVRDAMGRNISNVTTDTGQANGEFGDPSVPGTFNVRY